MNGPVLVTGGAGFLGQYIVQALLQEPNCRPIVSVNRDPSGDLHNGVDYRAGSIADAQYIRALIDEVQPQAIFHVATAGHEADERTSWKVNVEGTKNLLDVATNTASVKAFIFSSSVNVATGNSHHNIDETLPLWKPESKTTAYLRTKAEAERLVLSANRAKFRTVSLRPCLIVGPGDPNFVPIFLDTYHRGETNLQLGYNTNLFDAVSAANCAEAHILAAKALLGPSSAADKVAGEAFNITNGDPIPFWDLCRLVWRAAGDTSDPGKVWVIPAWAASFMAAIAEFFSAVFTLGAKKPTFTREGVKYCVNEFTYNTEKARKLLKYSPKETTEETLRKSVEWELRRRADRKEQQDRSR